jgi:hypothetical protein
MSAVRQFACEVCHTFRDHSGDWLLVPDETWGSLLHILPWDDQVAAEPGIYHLCGAHHAKQLTAYWLSAGYLESGVQGIVWSISRRSSEVRDWQITPLPERHPVSRFPGAIEEEDPDTLLAMRDVIETLQDAADADEDVLCEAFDA